MRATIVYLDTVLLHNVLADGLLLLAAGRLAGLPLRRWRIFAAALLGGCYAAARYLPAGDVLGAWWAKLLTAALMVRLAFGGGGRFLRRYLLFLLTGGGFAGVELALAGLAGGAPRFSLPLFGVSFLLSWLLLGVVFRGGARSAARRLRLSCAIRHGGQETVFTALADSGCTLSDPLTGESVPVVELEALRPLFSAGELTALRRGQSLPTLPLTALRFSSLGGGGSLTAFRAEELRIGGRTRENALIAVAPSRLGGDGTFHALWGGEECG